MKSGTQIKTPNDLNFRMPAEWEPHEATWLGWPHEVSDWPGKFAVIPWAFAEIVRHLARMERVYLLVQQGVHENRVRILLNKSDVNLDNVYFFRVPTDRGWMRDSGPICVVNPAREVAFNHFVFNGWAKYSNHKRDALAVTRVNERLRKKVWNPTHVANPEKGAGLKSTRPSGTQGKTPLQDRRVVLEGGSIDVNGAGTLLTTEECLLSKTQERNPGFGREDYEDVFREYLGVKKVIWLKNGIAGDDTHGHVDDLSRFVDANTVVTIAEDNREDTNYAALRENLEILQSSSDQDGKPLRVVTLPMPAPVHFAGQRLPASYANFYIANKLVIMPTFTDVNDRVALNTLAELFPSREVIGIPCRDLVLGLGTLHCMTQQQPAGR